MNSRRRDEEDILMAKASALDFDKKQINIGQTRLIT
jgi:hypothetical protein